MNRFELKYLVATKAVPDLIAAMGDYLVPDPHADPDLGYRVTSIYWDTPALGFFWEKIEGVKYRRKLRMRRYDDTPNGFVEIKQREDRTLHKRRLKWPIERIDAVFGDGTRRADWSALADDPVATEVALMIDRLALAPKVGISYRRRAFFGAFDPELRISFDSRLIYRMPPVTLAKPFDEGAYIVDPRVTVLEFKYDHRAPTWLTKLVCRRGLKMVRMSKYCSAIDLVHFGGSNT